jgi:glycosyltransferase involved in cell wall biosynthesis
MRILLVTPMPPQEGGGGAIPILLKAQVEGLAGRNELTLVSTFGDEAGEAEAAALIRGGPVEAHFADRRVPAAAGARWRRRARLASSWAFGRRPWRAIWFGDPGVQRILDRLAREHEFDVVVVEDSAMSPFRLPEGAATVLTEYEVLRPRPAGRPPASPAAWPSWAAAEIDWRRRPGFQRRAWRRFDRVLAFTRRDAEAIASLAPEVSGRVRVSPFGLVLPPAPDPGLARPGTLLFVGNFTHQPNRDAAAWLVREIMPALRERAPEATLNIVGTAPTPEVLSLAGPGVEVIGDVDSVAPHMQKATVVVAPIRTGGGMRMKILEAIAAGKPVVTTSRGSAGFDDFDEPLPFAVADDEREFAAATAALLEDGEARTELGRRAREAAKRHYGPAAWARRLEAIYEDACRERRERRDG